MKKSASFKKAKIKGGKFMAKKLSKQRRLEISALFMREALRMVIEEEELTLENLEKFANDFVSDALDEDRIKKLIIDGTVSVGEMKLFFLSEARSILENENINI
jgi:hypothetical protein